MTNLHEYTKYTPKNVLLVTFFQDSMFFSFFNLFKENKNHIKIYTINIILVVVYAWMNEWIGPRSKKCVELRNRKRASS